MEQTTKGKYTLETLRPVNLSFDREHLLMEEDVSMVNRPVEVIEQSRSDARPQIGDRLRLTDKYGDFYPNTLLEKERGKNLSVCMNPYIPFVGTAKNKPIWIDVSGGPFTGVNPENLRFAGRYEGAFKAWGHCGATANGSVCFTAEVPLWEYSEPHPYYGDFTTETWRKIHIRKNVENGSRYLYSGDGIAFRTEEEYQQFLQDYEATVFPGSFHNHYVIWCFRQGQRIVPQEEWDRMKAPISERSINCYREQVKIVKNKEKHITTLYRIRTQQ